MQRLLGIKTSQLIKLQKVKVSTVNRNEHFSGNPSGKLAKAWDVQTAKFRLSTIQITKLRHKKGLDFVL